MTNNKQSEIVIFDI